MKIRPAFLQHGFTLMETVVCLVLLSIVAVVITSMNGNLFFRSTSMQSAQQATQLMQACMERLISVRKAAGYSKVTNQSCKDITASGSGGVTVTSTSCPSPELDDLNTFPGCTQFLISAPDIGIGTPIALIFVNN